MANEELSSNLEVLQEVFAASHCLLLQFNLAAPSSIYVVPKFKSNTENLIQFTLKLCQKYNSSLKQGHYVLLSSRDALTPIPIKNQLKTQSIYSAILLPLNSQDDAAWVVVSLYHCERDYFWSKRDILVLEKMATQCLLLIEKTQKINYYKSQAKLDLLLRQINEKLNSHLSSNEIFKEIFNLTGNDFNYEKIFLVQANKNNKMTIAHKWEKNSEKITSYSEDYTEEEILDYLEIELLDKPRQFCYIDDRNSDQKINLVAIPTMVRGELFGLLVLETKNCERYLGEIEVENLESVAKQIAIAIDYEQNQEFLSETVHELRNPLVGILGFARILQEQIYGSLNEKQLQYINLILNSGEYLRDLVNDFLDLSRVNADREELYLEKFAVEDLCLASLAIVRERAVEQGLDLSLEIADNVNFCLADQRRLKQILVNLLSNAVKFTEKGSVVLKVERQEQQLAFSIIDTGIGIDLEDQKKLFRPFGQIKKHPLTRKHKGSGLGLALSRKLAQLHGGDITLTSEVGQGSCVTVFIPWRAEIEL